MSQTGTSHEATGNTHHASSAVSGATHVTGMELDSCKTADEVETIANGRPLSPCAQRLMINRGILSS